MYLIVKVVNFESTLKPDNAFDSVFVNPQGTEASDHLQPISRFSI